jgi:hypothetical protein
MVEGPVLVYVFVFDVVALCLVSDLNFDMECDQALEVVVTVALTPRRYGTSTALHQMHCMHPMIGSALLWLCTRIR